MAIGLGSEMFKLLNRSIKADQSKGILLQHLKRLAQYHLEKQQSTLKLSNGLLTPLTEMYLVTTKIKHQFRTGNDGDYISGINYVRPEIRELVETINMGLNQSMKAAEEAERLYSIVYPLDSRLYMYQNNISNGQRMNMIEYAPEQTYNTETKQ